MKHLDGLAWPERLRHLQANAEQPALQQFYSATQLDPERPLNEQPLLAIDLETTGLRPEREHILAVGIQPFTLNRIPLGQREQWFVHSPRPVSEGAVAIHQITDSNLAQAPKLAEILPELIAKMAGHLMVVHYRAIERGFLNCASMQLWQEPWLFPVIDTMALEAQVYRQRRGWQRWFKRHHNKPSIRLGDARTRLGLPFYPPHDAGIDALATAELLQAQIAHRYPANLPIGQLWL
jgi:DNA polymerase-3 subunit epsilon